MRRFITLFFLIFTLSGVAVTQQMSNDQVVQYVKGAQKMGKTQKQITTELMRRGVTKEQVERIQERYENGNGSTSTQSNQNTTRSRTHTQQDDESDYSNRSQRNLKDQKNQKNQKDIKGLRQSANQKSKRGMDDDNQEMTDEDMMYEEDWSDEYMMKPEEDPTQQVFGHNIFTNENLTFEPNVNITTPVNYRLGPGDEVVINVWGASQTAIRQTISPEGSILVDNLGPIYLSGMTVREANNAVRREFSKIYAGISGPNPNTSVDLALGNIRTIQISIMGEVAIPGTYALSAFSSVFHALYRAGGVNKIGSLRSIKVVRNGKKIADLGVYDFIMKGKLNDDVRLQDGDVVIVDPYESLVQITGKVKRPVFYEMKPSKTMTTILKYSGGFTGNAYKKAIRLIRKTSREHQIYNVDGMDYSVFKLDDGDVLAVNSVLERFESRIEVRGAVYRADMYQIDDTVNTVKQLIKKAEGVRGDAFLSRAIINRENDDLTHEMIQIGLRGLLNGTITDIPLQKNDILYIPSIEDLKEEATLAIHGKVANPGTYLCSSNMSVEDLILQAGGLLEAASTARVNVSRRIKNSRSTKLSNVVGKTFSFELKDGFLVGGGQDFHLEPFDEVYIRRSPAYHQQQNVTVGGEVLFGGRYALSKKNERLSDLIAKAGGITQDAYIKDARLIRKMTKEELRRKEDALRMANKGGTDSISVKTLGVSDTYSVGIELEEALANPGSDFDMMLREGDILFMPEYISTVKINGAIMYPNTVLYKKGESLKYYINQAGGFASLAKKKRAFIVYMNGTVSRLRTGNSKAIEPGCEIIVPSKDSKKKISAAEIIGIGTSTASLATMIAAMVNLFK